MFEIHLWMLFAIGVLASIGTYAGIGTVYAGLLNLVAWLLIAVTVPTTTVPLGDGSTMTVGANAVGLTYFAYINAVGGLVPWLVTLFEWYKAEEQQVTDQQPDLEELIDGV